MRLLVEKLHSKFPHTPGGDGWGPSKQSDRISDGGADPWPRGAVADRHAHQAPEELLSSPLLSADLLGLYRRPTRCLKNDPARHAGLRRPRTLRPRSARACLSRAAKAGARLPLPGDQPRGGAGGPRAPVPGWQPPRGGPGRAGPRRGGACAEGGSRAAPPRPRCRRREPADPGLVARADV